MLSSGYSFWLKYAPNCSVAGALKTLLESSQRSPNPLAGKGQGKGGEGEEREGRKGSNRKREVREARGGCILLNLSLAIRPWFACNVCQFIVRGAGLCQSFIFNPKAFTVSHLASLAQASHQLYPAP